MKPTSGRPLQRRSRPSGFSLIELGIVIAVIAVLGTVVIGSVGYLRAARQQSCADLVQAIRKASQSYSMRYFNGIAYARKDRSTQDLLTNLLAEGFLPKETRTPWEPTTGTTGIQVFADDGAQCAAIGGRDRCTKCPGFACLLIRVPIGAGDNDVTCRDLATLFDPDQGGSALAARCNGGSLEVVVR